MTTQNPRRLAVALHGIDRMTYERCALIREWLTDLGVERVTLCVASPPVAGCALDAWLRERAAHGDAVTRAAAGPGRATAVRCWRPAGTRRADVLRVDVHPDDFGRHPRRTRAVERTLRRAAAGRQAITLATPPEDAPAGLRADVAGVLGAP